MSVSAQHEGVAPAARAPRPGSGRSARIGAALARPVAFLRALPAGTTLRGSRAVALPGPSVARPLAIFALSALVAFLVVGVGAFFLLRGVGVDHAMSGARDLTSVLGRTAVEPALTDGLLAGDPAAIASLDRAVRPVLVGTTVSRVKVWAPDGRILYSDDARLVGEAFALADDELEVLRTGHPVAGLSDLSAPENRFEQPAGQLLEVYARVTTPSGEPLLFEAYHRVDDVRREGREVWQAFLYVLVGALGLLALAQLPLAWRLASGLRRRIAERDAFARAAIDASEHERLRIARDLHDGPVQDLAGLSLTLAASSARAAAAGDWRSAEDLGGAGAQLRSTGRQLRTLLFDLGGRRLRDSGLAAALVELLEPLAAAGLETRVEFEEGLDLPADLDALIFRATREALLNVAEHAAARSVVVAVHGRPGGALLVVRDDGRGFDPAIVEERRREGHVGLALLGDLAEGLGGILRIRSAPGGGAVIELEVPAP
ncbi:MAG: histidine kinase [Thermoleophilia bacterium]